MEGFPLKDSLLVLILESDVSKPSPTQLNRMVSATLVTTETVLVLLPPAIIRDLLTCYINGYHFVSYLNDRRQPQPQPEGGGKKKLICDL